MHGIENTHRLEIFPKLSATTSIPGIQEYCRSFIERTINPPIGVDKFSGHVNRGEFDLAMDFARERIKYSESQEKKIFWLAMYNEAKDGIFLSFIGTGKVEEAVNDAHV